MDFNFLNQKEQPNKRKKNPKDSRFAGNILGAIVFFMLIAALYLAISGNPQETVEISISELSRDVQAGAVKNITVEGDKLLITYTDDSTKISKKETDSSLTQTLANYGVEGDKLSKTQIEIKSETGFMFWLANI